MRTPDEILDQANREGRAVTAEEAAEIDAWHAARQARADEADAAGARAVALDHAGRTLQPFFPTVRRTIVGEVGPTVERDAYALTACLIDLGEWIYSGLHPDVFDEFDDEDPEDQGNDEP